MIAPKHTKQFFMQAGSILNVLSTLYFSPQSILPICTLESLNYKCRSATHEFMQTLFQYWTIQHNPYQPRATSSIRLFFTVENRTLLLPALSLLFPSLLFFFPSFFLGRMLMYCSKGTFPVSSTSPFRKVVCVQPVPLVIMNFGHILA